MLEDARILLKHGAPARALEALDRAHTRFPSGALEQERRALHVEALFAHGDTDAASREAADFLRDFPASPLARRVSAFADPGDRAR